MFDELRRRIIIHDAGEAEASGPGPSGTTKIYKVGLGPLMGPELFNICTRARSRFHASGPGGTMIRRLGPGRLTS